MIVAMGQKNEIGRNNDLLWHLPDDFKWFIKHTKHKTVIMGRNTMNSLGKPLKNRRNIVLSSSNKDIIDGFEYYNSLADVLDSLLNEEEIMIIGGAKLYNSALSLSKRIYLTKVDATFDDADTYFTNLDYNEWDITYKEYHDSDDTHLYPFEFQILERR